MDSILLVDDDLALCQMLAEYLELEGFQVDTVHDGSSALQQVSRRRYALVILDVMMPGMNGFDTLKALRERGATPVLMMSARGEEVDRIVGLEIGADDYLPKPCSPRELVARIRAILRRVALEQRHQQTSTGLAVNGVRLDPDTYQAFYRDQPIDLTLTEFQILRLLIEAGGKLVSREQLMRSVLNRKLGPHDRSIDMHLSNIRRKLGPAHPAAVQIKTVRGAGYLLVKGEAAGDA